MNPDSPDVDNNDPEPEFTCMRRCSKELRELDIEGRRRVFVWLRDRYYIVRDNPFYGPERQPALTTTIASEEPNNECDQN